MLEQKTFYDKNHVAWLNRPGPARGLPAWWLLVLSLIPGQIFRLVTGLPYWAGFGVSAVFSIAALLCCVYVSFAWRMNQTCPNCHIHKMKGYAKCSGCGYPDSWS